MQIGVRAPVCFTHYTTPLPGAFFLPCLLMTRLKAGKRPKFGAEGAPRRLRAEKGIFSCAEWVTNCLPSRKMPQIRRGRYLGVVSGRKMPQILRGRCSEGIWGRKTPPILRRRCSEAVPGRKRHHFLRGMGYQLPAEQKNAPNPARKVLRRHLGQKNTPNPARNGLPTACRAEKHPQSCAEGASRQLQAEKGIFSCAEWDNFCREEY